MQTVEGNVCVSCREACRRLGILANDSECERALGEAFQSSTQPPRDHLASILVHCQPTDLRGIFESYKEIFITVLQNRF